MSEPKKLSNEELGHTLVETLGLLADLAKIISDMVEDGIHASHGGRRAGEVLGKIKTVLSSVGVEPN
jgi:hypothetical protein